MEAMAWREAVCVCVLRVCVIVYATGAYSFAMAAATSSL